MGIRARDSNWRVSVEYAPSTYVPMCYEYVEPAAVEYVLQKRAYFRHSAHVAIGNDELARTNEWLLCSNQRAV